MEIDQLVKMANEIGEFFETAMVGEDRVNATTQHLRNFWEPRMRRQIVAFAQSGGAGLKPMVREAILRLEPAATSA